MTQILTPPQRILLNHIIASRGLGAGAEDEVGLHGASFGSVLDALRSRGLINDENEPTSFGRAANIAAKGSRP